jgi:tripartite-type tricarboxylate transporter receptor subunit TctC
MGRDLGDLMQTSRRHVLEFAAGAIASGVVSGPSGAQSYPDRPIRLVVPFPPGGAYDSLARPCVDKIKPLLGPVFVENIGGAGASLGAATVARARPDGYTILPDGTLPPVNEALLKARPLYDPNEDLDPIMQLAVGYLASRCILRCLPSPSISLLGTPKVIRGKFLTDTSASAPPII